MNNNDITNPLDYPLGRFAHFTSCTMLDAFETEGLELDKYMDVVLSVIYLNQKGGSNQQKLTIERAMNTDLLLPLVEKVGGVNYTSEKLPDIQEFRLLFDSAVIFYACKSKNKGKLKELIKEVTGEDRIHLTIDSSKYLLDLFKCRDMFIETDTDLEEGQINNHKKLLDEMSYLVYNKWEKKEEEVEETDDVIEVTEIGKKLKKFIEHIFDELPTVVFRGDGTFDLPTEFEGFSSKFVKGYSFEGKCAFEDAYAVSLVKDIYFACLSRVIEVFDEDLSLYMLTAKTESKVGYINSNALSTVCREVNLETDLIRSCDVAFKKVFNFGTQDISDLDTLCETVIILNKLFKGRKKWWRCLESERF